MLSHALIWTKNPLSITSKILFYTNDPNLVPNCYLRNFHNVPLGLKVTHWVSRLTTYESDHDERVHGLVVTCKDQINLVSIFCKKEKMNSSREHQEIILGKKLLKMIFVTWTIFELVHLLKRLRKSWKLDSRRSVPRKSVPVWYLLKRF